MLRSKTCLFLYLLDLGPINITIPIATESQFFNILLPNTAVALNLGPPFESKLTILKLYDNNFSGDKVSILAECVRVCMSLETLHCWNCSLTSSEVIALLDYLKHSHCSFSHKNLERWSLDDNSIDDVGVNALIENIPKLFPVLKEIMIDNNPVTYKTDMELKQLLLMVNIK